MAVFTYDVRFEPLAPTVAELRDALEAERHAREAADEVFLTRAQAYGPDALPPGAESLLEEAAARSEALDRLLALRVERRRVVAPKLRAADWRDAQPLDWSRSRRAS
jgi:hypothetical protein